MISDDDATQSIQPKSAATGHEKHCFVVMPTGRDSDEKKWFAGWYKVVIRAAIIDAGFEPVLAADEQQPGAINDEIRTHLAYDPIIIVDIGGAQADDDPNPNVMYELGIRHALSLPMVMMAWKDQRLPFDVNNQRIIMEGRDYLDLDSNKDKLLAFIKAALQGKYYRPMDAVGRLATIQAAYTSLGEESLLGALAKEVRDLRISLSVYAEKRQPRAAFPNVTRVKSLMRGLRKQLYLSYVESGGDMSTWGRVLRTSVSEQDQANMRLWSVEEWKSYIASHAQKHGAANQINLPLEHDNVHSEPDFEGGDDVRGSNDVPAF